MCVHNGLSILRGRSEASVRCYLSPSSPSELDPLTDYIPLPVAKRRELALAQLMASTMGAMNAKARYGPLPCDAHPFTRKCRLLQSWYRVEVLGQAECGPWRKGAQRVGSMLVGGETSGANFLSPSAFAYAKKKVAQKKANPKLTIDEYRLFNNMLSSMPMCFNLFADFRAGVRTGWPNAGQVLAAMFAESPITQVVDVEIELIPRPTSDYTDDKTAFDAAVIFRTPAEALGLASIETKYTDQFGGNVASKQARKLEIARKLDIFGSKGYAYYEANGFDQVARNLMLTLAYAARHDCGSAINYVLAPEADDKAPAAVGALRDRLMPAYRDSIVWLPLETVVERGLGCADTFYADHLMRFSRRYLDFSQVAHLMPPA